MSKPKSKQTTSADVTLKLSVQAYGALCKEDVEEAVKIVLRKNYPLINYEVESKEANNVVIHHKTHTPVKNLSVRLHNRIYKAYDEISSKCNHGLVYRNQEFPVSYMELPHVCFGRIVRLFPAENNLPWFLYDDLSKKLGIVRREKESHSFFTTQCVKHSGNKHMKIYKTENIGFGNYITSIPHRHVALFEFDINPKTEFLTITHHPILEQFAQETKDFKDLKSVGFGDVNIPKDIIHHEDKKCVETIENIGKWFYNQFLPQIKVRKLIETGNC